MGTLQTQYAGRRVAFLHHQLSLGGSERVSYDAACFLQGLGIESYFFAALYDKERWLESGAKLFPVIQLPKRGKNHCFTSPNVDVIIESILREDITLLFVAVPDTGLPTRIQQATGCRVVFWLHSIPYFEAITKIESYRTQGERSWYNRLIWQLLHRPRLLWGNRYLHYWHEKYRERLNAYDVTIVLDGGYRQQIIDELQLSEVIASRLLVKHNLMEIATSPILSKQKQIIYMGRLSRSDKRIDRLLLVWSRVMHKLPDWELRIYGSGDKEERFLRQLARNLKIERCTFEGFISKPIEAYNTAAICCMTSSYEGWGLALTEAQNQGVIPIAFDSSWGIRTILADGGGVLVPAFDMDAYAKQLLRLCLDEDYREAMQQTVLQRRWAFSRKHENEEWTSILDRCLRADG